MISLCFVLLYAAGSLDIRLSFGPDHSPHPALTTVTPALRRSSHHISLRSLGIGRVVTHHDPWDNQATPSMTSPAEINVRASPVSLPAAASKHEARTQARIKTRGSDFASLASPRRAAPSSLPRQPHTVGVTRAEYLIRPPEYRPPAYTLRPFVKAKAYRNL